MMHRSPLSPSTTRPFASLAALALLLTLLAIAPPIIQPVAAAPAGFATVPVGVPVSMRWGTFASARTLTIPVGFEIAVYARVDGARFLANAPDDALLVSQPSTGKVLRLRANGTADPTVAELFSGLRRPHDMVFYRDGATTWLYIAESHRVSRAVYGPDGGVGPLQPIITGLPDSSTPELRGAYGHELKNLALGPDGALYLSIASTCNVCVEDTTSDPIRGAIYRYNADGTGRRLYARGLRNAEGLAFVLGTGDLWAAVNNRDGLGDDFPSETLVRVRDGGDYGWPFCNVGPDDSGALVYRRDPDTNADGHVDCGAMTPVDTGIQAHSAPLGLTFLGGTAVPSPWSEGALIGYHGSWNRARKTGYKFAWFPWVDGRPGAQVDLISGWLDEATQAAWGRPVDSAVDATGAIFLSDDASGTIYRLAATATTPPPPPPPPTPTATATPPPPSGGTPLSGRPWTTATNGWGPVERDRANGEQGTGDGGALRLDGVTYDSGLGVHARGEIRYVLDGGCSRFRAIVGVDDEVGARGSVVQQVWADGVKRFDSGPLTGAGTASVAEVDLAGVRELRLVVEDGGDDNLYDHADWADARVWCAIAPAPPMPTPPSAPPPARTGLRGEYFQTAAGGILAGSEVVRLDPILDFHWGSGAPAGAEQVGGDDFGVRWTGTLAAAYSETYTLIATSDDGVRVWVDGRLIIDNWSQHGETEDRGTIALQAGQPVTIRVEYFEAGGDATLVLAWASPSQPREVIPASRLSPPAE